MKTTLLKSAATLAIVSGFMMPMAAMATPTTYTHASGQAITNNTTIVSDMVINDTGMIDGLTIELDIEHTWIGDLIIQLTGPDGFTTITLMDRPGIVGGGCCGDSSDFVFGTSVIFDDAALTAAENAGAGLGGGDDAGGTYAPDGLLSTFVGGNLAGTWSLSISDNFGGDTGNLRSWSLHVDASRVPEPEILALFGFGLIGMGALRRRRQK
ncbi:proprotein convertase P-domain-containing protein [Paremcibacter congregatus]|uniref:proprotein convertase P-domain-containing protein n=1 Tax=Paremcibacter congregatus TaxID=2043170 RepID=UPI003A92D70A